MIVVVVPNPSLDKTVVIPGFTQGRIHRPGEMLVLAGGKGCNFARALQRLGQSSKIIAPIGGYAGQYLLELATREGLQCEGPRVNTELRTCLTIIDPEGADEPTEIYEQGAPLDPAAWEELIEQVEHYLAEATFLAVCGSFPPGVPEEGLTTLLCHANAAGRPVLLDTYGPQLLASLQFGPALLKINQQEAAEMTGYAITDPAGALKAAAHLQRRGARQVVITLGKQGAVGLTAEGEEFGWRAPVVASVYPTGSGDSFFAGVTAGLMQGQHLSEAVRLGIAVGAANTLQIGAGRLEISQVEEILHHAQKISFK